MKYFSNLLEVSGLGDFPILSPHLAMFFLQGLSERGKLVLGVRTAEACVYK